jgi:parvulin-like peptidyl-prolyl isomerase
LNSGEVGPLIETPTGYHIIRVIDHVPGGKTPFERACPDIRRRLQNKIGQIEYKRVVEELRAKAHIENSLAK